MSSRGGERPGAEHGLHWSGEDCVPGAECRDTQKEGTLSVALHGLGTQSCPQWAAEGGLLRTRCPCHTCDIREGLDSRGHKDHIVWSRVQIRGTRAQCSGGSSPDSEDLSHHLPLRGDRKSHATAPDPKHLKPTTGLPAPRAEAQGDGEREHCWHTGTSQPPGPAGTTPWDAARRWHSHWSVGVAEPQARTQLLVCCPE